MDLGWVRAAGDAKAFSSPLANASSFLLNDKVAEKVLLLWLCWPAMLCRNTAQRMAL